MKTIVEYRTLTALNAAALDQNVNGHLGTDWELYGQPYAAKDGDENLLCQAMVKFEEKEQVPQQTFVPVFA